MDDQETRYIPIPTDRTIKERVKRGAKYLDEHLDPKIMGFEWRNQITNDLDLANASMCVLGQVFGDYVQGLGRLAELNGLNWTGEGARAPVAHGFCVPWRDIYVDGDGKMANNIYWARLELAWRRELGLDVLRVTRNPVTGYFTGRE